MGCGDVGSPHRVVQVEAGPDSLAGFRADYSDAFSVAAVAGSTASSWARRCLGGAELANGVFKHAIWHGALGFDLAAGGTPGTFVGWQISTDLPKRFVLDADGRLMRGRMIFQISPTVVTWTTMLAFHRPAAARIWSVAAHIHRAVARTLLGRAAASLERHPSSGSSARY